MNINQVLAAATASSRFGSQMGRADYCYNDEACVYLQRVEMVDGDYDRGGVYWGGRPSLPLWCAMDEANEVRLFVRAATRYDAKRQLLEEWPTLHFFR